MNVSSLLSHLRRLRNAYEQEKDAHAKTQEERDHWKEAFQETFRKYTELSRARRESSNPQT